MGQRFQKDVVVVTGASSGIGRATAEAFSREGARVVIGARRKEKLEDVAAAMRRGGREARAVPCNVTVPTQVQRLVDAAVDRWGRLDVVVANAGVGLTSEVANTSREDFRHCLDVNVMGVWNTITAALPTMLDQGHGHLVIVSSVLGYRGIPRFAGYCATKAALVGLSEGLRTEVEPQGLSVTLVCPGLTETEFFDRRLGEAGPEPVRDAGRATSPELVARRIVGGVARGRKRVVVSPDGRLLVWLSRHFPGIADTVVAGYHRRSRREEAGREASESEESERGEVHSS